MNGNGTLTAALRLTITPELKKKLWVLARTQRRSLSSAVRVLLEEAMELEETLTPADPQRSEYEIHLTVRQAARMVRKGYDIQVWEPKVIQGTLF